MMAQQAPLAFLLHGYLGVGKTTLARRLEAEHAAIRFTHDEWMRALYGNDPPEAFFAEYAGRVSGLIEATWTRCLELGLNVVLDFGFGHDQSGTARVHLSPNSVVNAASIV
jgi:predicted kinase